MLILADDLGIGDPTCYNRESKISTPHIDRIAREGMRFSDVHSASSVCSPTRYAILTGRYAWRTRMKSGVLQGYSRALIDQSRPTLPSILKQAGYATAGFGKWHLGFQQFHPGQSEGEQPVVYATPLRPGPVRWVSTSSLEFRRRSTCRLIFSSTTIIRSRCRRRKWAAAATVNTHAARFGGPARFLPCFIMPTFCRGSPHGPLRFSTIGQIRWPQTLFPVFRAHGTAPPYLPGPHFVGKSGAGDYGDFVSMVDSSVGEVLAALDRGGLADKTLLFMTSDNGARWTPEEIRQFGHRSNLNNRGQKSDIYDGGHRIPFLVRWPGKVRPGSTSDELGCLVDLMATCAAAAGVPLAENAAEDSFNLLPAILSQPLGRPIRDAVVHHSGSGMFALRSGDWKLAFGLGSGGFTPPAFENRSPGEPAGQLYNLATDRQETDQRLCAAPRDRPCLNGKTRADSANRTQSPGGINGPDRCRNTGLLAKLGLPKCVSERSSFLVSWAHSPRCRNRPSEVRRRLRVVVPRR